jgi:hypothetical protein
VRIAQSPSSTQIKTDSPARRIAFVSTWKTFAHTMGDIVNPKGSAPHVRSTT